MHAALMALGPELNDLLGVCASRVVEAPTTMQSPSPADADGEEAILGSFMGTLETLGERSFSAPESQVAFCVLLRATASPKCERCWRHAPTTDFPADLIATKVDGWLYRGCACYK